MTNAVEANFRPFTWDDLPTVVDIINRCDAVDGLERGISEPELRTWWTEPGIDPETNGFIATVAGEPVGYGLIRLRKGGECSGVSKFQTYGLVPPEWRGRGIGTHILTECERRAQARLDEAPTSTVYFGAYADVRQTDVVALYAHAQMRPVRYSFEMVYDSPEPPAAPVYPLGYGMRTFVRGQDEEATLRVLNTAFHDH